MPAAVDYTDLAHTGPGTPAGNYCRLFWHPVYRSEDLAPGQAVPIRIMNEDWTLYRGEDGAPHIVAFRCAHRGTQLSVGWVEGDCIRCRYHGWKYDGDGQCVEQPGEDASFAARVRIRVCPAEDYIGLIFGFFGEDETPPIRRFPDFDRAGIVITDPIHTWPCNYTNLQDNDRFHVVFTHRATTLRRNPNAPLQLVTVSAEETDYGMVARAAVPGELPSPSHYFMPDISYVPVPIKADGRELAWEYRLFFNVPVDDTHCMRISTNLVHMTGDEAERYREERKRAEEIDVTEMYAAGEAILAGQMTLEDLRDRFTYYQQFYIEDYVTQCGQGAIGADNPEHPWRHDVQILLKRKITQREVQLLAEGEPLTPWVERAVFEGDLLFERKPAPVFR